MPRYRFVNPLTKKTRPSKRIKGRGTIYFALSPNGEDIKIGFTRRLKYRARELNPGGTPLRVILTLTGTYGMEYDLHCALAPLRLGGEWFRYDDNMRRFLGTL